jgi:hypothetical protein
MHAVRDYILYFLMSLRSAQCLFPFLFFTFMVIYYAKGGRPLDEITQLPTNTIKKIKLATARHCNDIKTTIKRTATEMRMYK